MIKIFWTIFQCNCTCFEIKIALVNDEFNVQEAVGGGNLLILGKDQKSTLKAANAATKAMSQLTDIILPFPNGVVRSGSKVGSKYKKMIASTNDAYCPTLRGVVKKSELDDVYE